MRYLGSKRKISKYILPIMLDRRTKEQYWVEPFVGGCNMIDKIDGPRMGNDINPYLISLWVALQNGYIPPTNISRDEYYDIKQNPKAYPPELVAFVGFMCSFGGKWWGGYVRDASGRNYAESGSASLVKQSGKIQGIVFTCVEYASIPIPPNSLIYCDPPYDCTTKYDYCKHFDSSGFWEWCRSMARYGHTVFVSEYSAPPHDFVCLLEMDIDTILNKNMRAKRTEKLFMHSSQT